MTRTITHTSGLHTNMWLQLLVVGVTLIATISCTTTPEPKRSHAPLDSRFEVSASISLISAIPQDKLVKNFDRSVLSTPTVTTMPSYYSPSVQATGLVVGVALAAIEKEIGEAIERSRYKEAEQDLIPLISEVDDFDFRDEFWRTLDESVLQASWIDVKDFQRDTSIKDATITDITQVPTITIVTGYSLTQEYAFVSESVLKYYLAGTKDPAYELVFKYYDDPFKNLKDSQERLAAWTADNGREYRVAVANAIKDTMTVLQSSFFNPSNSRGLSQIQSHDRNHEIVPKGTGFVVSVPRGYNED